MASRSSPPAPRKKPTAAPKVRRKRRREPLPWRAILWTLLVVNIVAGLRWSPAISVRRVAIEGAGPGGALIAEEAVSKLRGKPALRADALGIESAALADPRFEGAEFRRSLLGSGRLTLRRRVPVAVVADPGAETPLMMDASGTVYDSPEDAQGEGWKALPVVILPGDLRMTAATLGAPCDLRRLAEIAVGVRPIAGPSRVGIEVKGGGVICLNMESARVRLGTGERLEAKLSMLGRILAGKPGILKGLKELNLMSPDHPKEILRGAAPSKSVSQKPAPESAAPGSAIPGAASPRAVPSEEVDPGSPLR